MMSCETIRQQLSGCLDDGQSPSKHVREHLETCPACREFYAACRDIGERLTQDSAGRPVVSPLVKQAIMARCRNTQPGSAGRNWRRLVLRFASVATATAALIALAIFVKSLFFSQTQQLPPVVEKSANADPNSQASADGSTKLVAWLMKNPDIVPQTLSLAGQTVSDPVREQTGILVKKGADFASGLAAAIPINSGSTGEP